MWMPATELWRHAAQLAQYFCTGAEAPPQWRHYALGEAAYTHFTSPIRRYPDVIVHRLLAAALAGQGQTAPPHHPHPMQSRLRQQLQPQDLQQLPTADVHRGPKREAGGESPADPRLEQQEQEQVQEQVQVQVQVQRASSSRAPSPPVSSARFAPASVLLCFLDSVCQCIVTLPK